jgi:hypothetical protein
MVHAISKGPESQPVAPTPKTATQKPAQSQPPSAGADSVHLSQAAQAMVAAMQEARETSQQTAKEASGGDLQAQRLLAKEAAAKPATK